MRPLVYSRIGQSANVTIVRLTDSGLAPQGAISGHQPLLPRKSFSEEGGSSKTKVPNKLGLRTGGDSCEGTQHEVKSQHLDIETTCTIRWAYRRAVCPSFKRTNVTGIPEQ